MHKHDTDTRHESDTSHETDTNNDTKHNIKYDAENNEHEKHNEHNSNPKYFELISVWFILNTILNFSGRIVLSKEGVGFPAPFTYTVFHMLSSSIYGISVSNNSSLLSDIKLHWRVLLLTGVCNALAISLNNLSFVNISVGMNQIIKACVPLPTIIFEKVIFQKTHSDLSMLSTICIVCGTIIICKTNAVSVNITYGIIAASLSSIITALRTVLSAFLLQKNDLQVSNVLTCDSLVSVITLTPFVLYELRNFVSYILIMSNLPDAIISIVCTSILAVLYNHIGLKIAKNVTPLTMTLMSTVRQSLLLIISVVTENNIIFTISTFIGMFQISLGILYKNGSEKISYSYNNIVSDVSYDGNKVKKYAKIKLTIQFLFTIVSMFVIAFTSKLFLKNVVYKYRHMSAFYIPDNETLHEKSGKAAWVTSCNDNYVKGVIKLKQSLEMVGSEYPLITMGFDLSNESRSLLNQHGIEIRNVDLETLYNPYEKYWTAAFAKMEMWKWEDYDTLCWLDSDTILLHNSDELLRLPIDKHGIGAALDFEIWPPMSGQPTPSFKMIQSGVFVMKPSYDVYNDMQEKMRTLPSYDGGDQGFLTSYFSQGNFDSSCILSSKYDYMIRGLYRDYNFNLTNINILHYVGHPKPWKGGQDGNESLQLIWDSVPNVTSDMLEVSGRFLWSSS